MQRIFRKVSVMLFIAIFGANSAYASELTQKAEKALAIMAVPAGLATHANIQNAKTAAYIKLLEDALVIGNCGVSFYNKSMSDSRDLSYYKVLDAMYRVRDMMTQVHRIKFGIKDAPVTEEQTEEQTEEEKTNTKKLLKIAQALSLSLVQSAARVHVAFNTTDTEEQRKIRYWCDAVAFFSNRLTDLIYGTLSLEEIDIQLAGTITGLLLFLAYTPERLQLQPALDRARELANAGRAALEEGGRVGRRVLEGIRDADPAGRLVRVLRNGKRMFADVRDSLTA